MAPNGIPGRGGEAGASPGRGSVARPGASPRRSAPSASLSSPSAWWTGSASHSRSATRNWQSRRRPRTFWPPWPHSWTPIA